MKKSLALLIVVPMMFVSCNKQAAPEVKIVTDDDKTFYSVGNVYGKRFKEFNLSKQEEAALMKGVRDGVTKDKAEVDTMKFAYKFRDIIQKRMGEKSKGEKSKGISFLENFVKNEGGKKTASGLAYKIITPGDSQKPAPTDIVKVHYKGTLIDGTTFDSSYERKKPIEFPLNRVIKGWTEGMQLIGKGGKVMLVIPSELAYKDQGAPPKIPGGATLSFEVELIDFKKSAAAPAAPAKSIKK